MWAAATLWLCSAQTMRPVALEVDHLSRPLAIGRLLPRVGWSLEDPRPGALQSAYEAEVAGPEGTVWSSGKVAGAKQSATVGTSLQPMRRYRLRVRVWDAAGDVSDWAESEFETGPHSTADWGAAWVASPDPLPPTTPATESAPATGYDALPTTHLRGRLVVPSKPVRARLYATALGAYEVSLNGKRVGDQILAPEWTDYASRVQFQAYDVTGLVQQGENAIEALLGDGWYAGRLGMAQALDPRRIPRGVYGRRAWFRALLQVETEGGGRVSLATGPGWECATDGPVRSSDILDGETFHARVEPKSWKPALTSDDATGAKVVAQACEPIRVVERREPVEATTPRPGTTVLDFGQNLAGWMTCRLVGKPGAQVVLLFAEALGDDGLAYTANLRGAPQRDTVRLDSDGRAELQPHFTYHGFRFVQVDGAEDVLAPVAEAFCTSAAEVGTFACSDPMVSRLWQNIRWTARANLMSVPTDCPQRDERLGWTGDIVAFGQTLAYMLDTDAFYTKWMADLRDSQAADGRFPDFAPHPYGKDDRFTGAPGWGDAGVVCAWVHYMNSGDEDALRAHLPSMRRYLDWVAANNPDGVWRNRRHNDYGDWLNGDTLRNEGWDSTGSEMPKEAFATAMWHQSATLASQSAEAVGDPGAAEHFRAMAAKTGAAFAREFVSPDGTVRGDTQAGYALALWLGLVPEAQRPAAVRRLLAAVGLRGGHLSTGFHSTLPMFEVLSAEGQHDVAAAILHKRTFPSWGYTIDNGATTVWERWDGYVAGRGFQDPGMNSFNHWALGSVGQWLFERVAGMALAGPGWSRVRFTLVPTPGMDWAEASRKTPGGTAGARWEREGGRVRWTLDVPANCTAEIVGASQAEWAEGGGRLVKRPGRLEAPAGRYVALL